MFEDSGFKYFLLLVDVFSSKVFTVPLKTRNTKEVLNGLKKIISNFKAQIYVLQADKESAFISKPFQDYLKSAKIVFRPKFGKNKAAIAENYIHIVKRRLYMLLRGTLNIHWVEKLPKIIEDLNNTPLTRLGYLKPNDISSEKDSVSVDKAKKAIGLPIIKEPSYLQQRQNINDYKGDLKVLDYVYKQFDSKVFDKSFDVSV